MEIKFLELLSNSIQPHKKTNSEFFIQSAQDGLFFGLSYLQDCLDSENFSKIKTYFSEGECIFKDQILLCMDIESVNFKKEELLSAISYLSGAYTLVSCFTEKSFDFSICANSTPNFKLSQWEERAFLKAGAFVQTFPKKILSFDLVEKELKKRTRKILLSELKISREKIRNILEMADSSCLFDLHGSFLPSDLEEFREFRNIDSVYSVYLQGSFPYLPMKFAE